MRSGKGVLESFNNLADALLDQVIRRRGCGGLLRLWLFR